MGIYVIVCMLVSSLMLIEYFVILKNNVFDYMFVFDVVD